jgi:outer membrane protein assembly factor BamD (BamD/ComL family)
MPSAIELYQEAYEADYRNGNWEYARELYDAIIQKFPHSEEAEYCRVHLDRLEKLKSDPNDRELQSVRSKRGPSALSVMSLILVVPLVAAAVIGAYFIWNQHESVVYNELLQEGQINERAGLFDAAAQKYEAAQSMMPTNALSYRLLAELYLQRNKWPLAEVQFKGWQLTYADDPDLAGFEVRLKTKIAQNPGRK